MSHFSKIKTNISNADMLIKTLKQMEFKAEYYNDLSHEVRSSTVMKSIIVYHPSYSNRHLLSLNWNGKYYNLVVDLQLWNLDMSFEYFVDLLSQNYAHNIILDQGFASGFSKLHESMLADGSIKLTLKRWSSNSFM